MDCNTGVTVKHSVAVTVSSGRSQLQSQSVAVTVSCSHSQLQSQSVAVTVSCSHRWLKLKADAVATHQVGVDHELVVAIVAHKVRLQTLH
eukprot:274400-Prorocentrum_minimum.AAC.1